MDTHPEAGFIFANFKVHFESTGEEQIWFDKPHVKRLLDAIPQGKADDHSIFSRSIYDELIRNNFIGTSTVLIRKSVLTQVGMFDERYNGIEDRDLWLRCASSGCPFAMISDVLSIWTQKENNYSVRPSTLMSRITFWTDMLNNTVLKDEQRSYIEKDVLPKTYYSLGMASKGTKEFGKAGYWYMRALLYGTTGYSLKSVVALLKLPIIYIKSILSERNLRGS
jgi:hypothetical protein